VARLRAVQQMFAYARARNSTMSASLKIYPAPSGPCASMRPGETLEEILARPSGDVICFHSGRRATVEQIRSLHELAMRSFPAMHRADTTEPSSSAPAVMVTTKEQLFAELQHAPDSTVLINAKGNRVTVGQVRSAIVQAHGRTLYPSSNALRR
jgi:hypothetical protein